MKKVLFISNISRGIGPFSMSSMKAAKELGYEFHVAANFNKSESKKIKEDEDKYEVRLHHIDFDRSPIHPNNIKAYKQLLKLMKKYQYDIIHCNTPVGGLLGRLAAKRLNIKKVIYMAHGFHFYKGAPFKNWLLYYPVEKVLARITDIFITINKEDFKRVDNFNLRGKGKSFYLPGVGVELTKFYSLQDSAKYNLRERKFNILNIPSDAYIVLSVGELNNNKNHETIIKAIAKLDNDNIYYIICGQGALENYLRNLAVKLGVGNQIKLLGFRTDIPDLLSIVDAFVFPSKREGLGLAALEAMSSGLPIITSNVHGIIDYSINGRTGYSVQSNDVDGFAKSINRIQNDPTLSNKMGEYNKEFVKKYEFTKVKNEIKDIYNNM